MNQLEEDLHLQLQCKLMAHQLLQISDKFQSELLLKRQKLQHYENQNFYKLIFWRNSSILIQFLLSTFFLNDFSYMLQKY